MNWFSGPCDERHLAGYSHARRFDKTTLFGNDGVRQKILTVGQDTNFPPTCYCLMFYICRTICTAEGVQDTLWGFFGEKSNSLTLPTSLVTL